MKKIEFSDCTKQTIVDMYKNGMSAVKIGQIYGCSRNPIKKVLNEYGIKLDNVLRKIPKEEYQNVIELYNSGMTQEEVAHIYGCQKHIVNTIMKKSGAKVRPNGFSVEDATTMYEMYKRGKRMQEIAETYGIDRHTVGLIFKRNGFVSDRKTYHFNEHYFDIVNTVNKAYILGLLWADGHNDVSRGKITLQLQEKDKELLEHINSEVESDRPLWFCPLHDKNKCWSNTYTLTFQSRHMSNVLESYGMVQRKSLVLEFPDFINTDLYGAFIRGYLDGDGSICFNHKTKKTEVSMIGTIMFLERIQEICKQFDINTSIYKKSHGNDVIRTLHVTNKPDRVKFLNWIYKDANLKMERKYIKYQQLLDYYSNINNSLVG